MGLAGSWLDPLEQFSLSIRVRFACGHLAEVNHKTVDAPPVCVCGETQIMRTFARAPRFVGACSGPYAETKALDPAVVNLATKGPLILREQE